MTEIRAKRPRLRLEPEAYRQLCLEVLERDRWRCQSCGRMEGLQVHHIQPRSRLGNDTDENLVALCIRCHQEAHRNLGDGETRCTDNSLYPVIVQRKPNTTTSRPMTQQMCEKSWTHRRLHTTGSQLSTAMARGNPPVRKSGVPSENSRSSLPPSLVVSRQC